ncbi:amidase domain-containing protein [Streptomyces chrestomyceticus]|uniref:amidase domain-containing protein n=1 Tax=Streptomyces chrestomyceticus TaxID=68185 RepID=UPI0037A93EEC
MVNYEAVINARPGKWHKAAEEWETLAKHALRDHVLRQAGEADNTAAAKFAMLTAKVNVADPDEALKVQNKASQAEMEILSAEIPRDAGAMTQRMWWNGLSEKQRHDLMLADPADGKFDRVKMVEYALQNWDQDDPIDFGDNCTNFVSQALDHAGMQKKLDFWSGARDDDTWGHESGIGNDWWDKSMYYSKSWGGAENQQDFMLRHGGEEVPRDQVRPGDIIYYEQAGDNDAIEKGNTHHAAVVTGVMPDGEIKYTQHSDPHRNVSLDGRLPNTEKAEGRQKVRIVRPHPDWY